MEEKKVVFSEDQKAVVLKSLADINHTNAQLYEWISKDILTETMSKKMPELIESHFSKAAKVLNFESYLLEEREQRYAEIRKAHQTIDELKTKLGSGKAIDGLEEQLKYLSRKVSKWWELDGFNHVSKAKFYPNGGLNMELCFMLESRDLMPTNDTPITNQRNNEQHIQYLRDLGFEFADFETGKCERLDLIDNQNNRTLLTNMLRKRFPSIKIHKWDNRSSYSNDDIYVLFHVDITIYDLSDI